MSKVRNYCCRASARLSSCRFTMPYKLILMYRELVDEERSPFKPILNSHIPLFLLQIQQDNHLASFLPVLMLPMVGSTNLDCIQLPPPAMAIYWTETPSAYAFVVPNILIQALARRIRPNREYAPTFYATSNRGMKLVSPVR